MDNKITPNTEIGNKIEPNTTADSKITSETAVTTHKRRVRYSGTHPKSFKEKYKELQPEKYAEAVEDIISKGKTPAGMHISICVDEILEVLSIKEGQVGLDATLGYGGHTKAMLECLNGKGHIFALDVDPIESAKTKERLAKLGFNDDILTICNCNFADINKAIGNAKLDFVLADLGLSSMQIDNPERGFSYKTEGPLDLRLNPTCGITAAERLLTLTEKELTEMLISNSDEPYAKEIAKAIMVEKWKGKPISTTNRLAEVIETTLKFLPSNDRKELIKKSCQRTFQAIRIDINKEFDVLTEFLKKLPNTLKSGGKVAILTFHSGEDRLVKKSFKELNSLNVYSDIAREVIRPSMEECGKNPRAKSAKLRWAIKA